MFEIIFFNNREFLGNLALPNHCLPLITFKTATLLNVRDI